MPGPSSATASIAVGAASVVTVPAGGLHLAALSSRLVTARSRRCGSPRISHGSASRRSVRRVRAGVTRSTARTHDVGQVDRLRASRGSAARRRASSTRSPTRSLSSATWARTSASSSARSAPGQACSSAPRSARAGRGWCAGWSAACAARGRRRRPGRAAGPVTRRAPPSIALNAEVSRASSSLPLHLDRVEPLGGRDVLCRHGQLLHRTQAGAGDDQAGVGGEGDARRRRREAARGAAGATPARSLRSTAPGRGRAAVRAGTATTRNSLAAGRWRCAPTARLGRGRRRAPAAPSGGALRRPCAETGLRRRGRRSSAIRRSAAPRAAAGTCASSRGRRAASTPRRGRARAASRRVWLCSWLRTVT